jgi:4-diphosphocytidyl-2-C-methyl-D-erythritol kinase
MFPVRVRALAKLNLTLEVLHRRPDGYHNLRTVFQTISLSDVLEMEVRRSRSSRIVVQCDVAIPGENLVKRAAEAVLETLGVTAAVSCRLRKRIPMGAGLGGGSSDAAEVLRVLPRLLKKPIPVERLVELGSALGSDVPFFLLGSTALGLGRGTELYPLPALPRLPVLVVAPDVHVSTAEAYRSLRRGFEEESARENLTSRAAWTIAAGEDWADLAVNDFEEAVFSQHPQLGAIRQRLADAGARPARMTGSGSALFGVFESVEARDRAAVGFKGERVFRTSFVRRMS